MNIYTGTWYSTALKEIPVYVSFIKLDEESDGIAIFPCSGYAKTIFSSPCQGIIKSLQLAIKT
jgi:hypothetical protein